MEAKPKVEGARRKMGWVCDILEQRNRALRARDGNIPAVGWNGMPPCTGIWRSHSRSLGDGVEWWRSADRSMGDGVEW
ncbi:MAG: hypothetical protein EBZ89_13600, partial [Chloroflexi bacterium]|nr:hypothetical protein [Chloroflexota bacterium]